MRKVQMGDVVSIHCIGKLKNGEIFENTFDKEPFVFQVGSPEVIPGLSEALIGMEEGEEKEVMIPSDKAFGPRDENLVRTIPKEALSIDVEPKEGLMLNLIVDTPQGEMNFPATIVKVTDEELVLDLNPPLAGEDLLFQIKLLKIFSPEEENIIL
ncbi:MAG: Peptidyl-prolyl cis-trans isomerase [Thermodesulfobacterium sp.]|uniref:Peptidyl-prolyl cis-trans isomerase n=1 Tax=Candidatus Thermodesulfobacterium syntrophicum TaxID=3060442 RepID=A0AAE3TDE6_9BACT|nr:Peptidyl-prolyl cis-trans isomerase [Candidatus Thermodesulfobacterium syntrophicum]